MTAMTLEDIYEEFAKLIDQMREFLDTHEDEDGNLSEEDAAIYDRMEAKAKSLRKTINRHEKIARADNYLSQPTSKPILSDPNEFGNGWNLSTVGNYGGKSMKRTSDRYRREFISAVRDRFQNAVTNSYLREGAQQSGGYLVPTELDEQIVSALEDANVMRQLCRVIQTAGSHRIPIVASKPAASWTSEGESLNFSDETFSQVTLEAYKLSVGLKISNELLQDAYYDLEDHIITECGNAIANSEEQAFLLGTGTNQPMGLLTSLDADTDAVIETTGAEITCDDIISLEYSLKRPYRKNAAFVTSDVAIAQIRRLKDSTGNFIWTPSLADGEPSKILGYPVYTSGYMPPARSGAISIVFGDFRAAYTIADRGERTFQPLRELFAVEDISAFIFRERVDGRLVDNQAVKALRVK